MLVPVYTVVKASITVVVVRWQFALVFGKLIVVDPELIVPLHPREVEFARTEVGAKLLMDPLAVGPALAVPFLLHDVEFGLIDVAPTVLADASIAKPIRAVRTCPVTIVAVQG